MTEAIAMAPEAVALATLAALPQPVFSFAADGRLLLANPAGRTAAGLAAEGGLDLAAVALRLAERGELGAGEPAALAAALLAETGPDPSRRVLRRATDGAWQEVRSLPLAGGGQLLLLQTLAEPPLGAVLTPLPGGVVVMDAADRLIFANPAAARLNGLPPEVLRPGMTMEAILELLAATGELDAAELAAIRVRRAARPEGASSIYVRRRPDGRTLRSCSSPIAGGGRVLELADITEQVRAGEEAQQRAAGLQLMLEHMRHGICLFDAGHRLVVANTLAHRLTGLPPEAMRPGRHIHELLQEQVARGVFGEGEAAQAAFARNLALDRSRQTRRIRPGPEGTTLEVITEPTPDGGYVVTFSDVTAHVAAEEAARAQAALLQATLETMRHGVMLFDRDRRLRFTNSLAAELAGHAPGWVRAGVSIAELLDDLLANGEFANAPEMRQRAVELRHVDRSRPRRNLRNKADGRVIEIRSEPLPDGGFVLTHTDVTPLARAEAEARRRADELQLIQDSIRHGHALYGADRRLIAANRLAAMHSSLSPEELLPGRSFDELVELQRRHGAFGPPDSPAAAAEVARILAFDRRLPDRYRRPLADGRVIEVSSDPTPGGGFVITWSDIAAQVQAEAAAVARTALLQTMQETMRHGIALFDADGRLITANRLAARLAGVAEQALAPGATHASLTAAQLAAGVFGSGEAAADEALRLRQADRRQRQQHQREMPDGTVVESSSDPMPDGGFVITWSDVTALVRAERAAEQRAATLQAMMENMRHGVALFGPDARLLAANRLIEEFSGFAPGAMRPGRSYVELSTEQLARGVTGDPALDADLATRSWTADRSRPHRYTRPGRDGRILDVASNPMPDGGFVVTITDITALARAEAEAQRRAGQLAVLLETIRHGVGLYGPDRRLILRNRLCYDISGAPEGGIEPGMTLAEVAAQQLNSGSLGPPEEGQAIVDFILGIDRSKPHRYQRRTPDGRLIEVLSDPTPDGGFVITFSDITALAEAEAEAASRAAMLQDALDTMRHGFILYGPDRRIRVANSLAVTYGGLQPEDVRPGITLDEGLRQQHARGAFGPEPEASAILRERAGRDRSRPFRTTRRLADGRVTEVSSDPTPDGGVIVTFSDITALVRAETEALERAATLKVAMDSIRHGMAFYGPDRRLRLANRLANRDYGLPELSGRSGELFDDLVCEQLQLGLFGEGQAAARMAAGVIGYDRSRPLRYQRRMPDGRVLDISSDPTPDGGFVITHSDVTELAEAKADASARAATLQAMLDNLRHGISYFGPDHRLIAHNALAEALIGAGPMTPGMSLAELVRLQQLQGLLDEAAAGEQALGPDAMIDRSRSIRYLRETPDGRRLEVSSNPTPD
ncbi:PAS-domain containing protein, partial [Siccirubricoccus sp. KC 17139]